MTKIHSMTGFAKYQSSSELGTVIWEIRSLNHRYCDINIQLPSFLRSAEPMIRQVINQLIYRGKIDISMKFFFNENIETKVLINYSLLNVLKKTIQEITSKVNQTRLISIDTLINWPGLIDYAQGQDEEIHAFLKETFHQALTKLIDARQQEGAWIKNYVQERIDNLRQEMNNIVELDRDLLNRIRSNIVDKINMLHIKVDQDRIEQEVVIMLQKMDIAEELSRLKGHLLSLEKELYKGEDIGRKMDFILQELYRESNTIASKSQDMNIANNVINIKVLIEQIKEQIQNIE